MKISLKSDIEPTIFKLDTFAGFLPNPFCVRVNSVFAYVVIKKRTLWFPSAVNNPDITNRKED